MLGLPMEIITMFISTIGGAYIRMRADYQADLAAERQYRAGRVDAARQMQNPNAAWMRRFITMAFIGMAYVLLLAPLLGMPTVVPVEVQEGFKFLFFDFTNTVTEYVTLEGMVTPDYLPHAIMAVVGFYFGDKGARR